MNNKLFAIAFTIFLGICALIIGFRIQSISFDSSVLSLLPRETNSKVDEKLLETYLKRLDKQVVFLIKEDGSKGQVANDFVTKLSASRLIDKVIGKVDKEEQSKFNTFLYENKESVISSDFRNKLLSDKYPKTVLANIYSGFSSFSQKEMENDLLMVTRNVGLELSKGSKIEINHNFLSVKDSNDDIWYFINAQTVNTGFDTKTSANFVNFIENCIETVKKEHKNTQIYKRGTVFYSNYSATSAQKDINILGSITLIGVFALIFLIYKSVVPVFLTLSSVFAGLLAATAALFLFFDAINLVMIGMCLSIIGVVCDYTIYFMTMRMDSELHEGPFDTIKQMSKPLLFAAGTDVIAYLLIVLSPISPLKQLAVFCMVAISVSCLFVIIIEPYLCNNIKRNKLPLKAVFRAYLNLIKRKNIRLSIIAILLVISTIGLFTIKANDDPASLQTMPYSLKSQDDIIAKYTNQNSSLKYIVIQADNEQGLLNTNEKIKAILSDLKKEKALNNFTTLPINSFDLQQNDCDLLNTKLITTKNYLKQNGFEIDALPYTCRKLSLKDFLASPIGQPYNQLVVEDNNHLALSVILEDVTKPETLKASIKDFTNVVYLDRRNDFTQIFSHFRELIFFVLVLFEVVILIIASIRLGILKGFVATLFSILCLTTSLSVLSLSGFEVNLFNELALILVLGIGINYIIFFSNNQNKSHTSIIAIFTALITTLLTIGILIFSSVNAICGFAITLSVGIICAFVLSTLLPEFFDDK